MTSNVVTLPARIIPEWTLADRIRKVRRDKGLSQEALAKGLDIERSRLAGWESGRNSPRDIVAVAEKLEAATGVPREWFLGWKDGPTTPSELPRLDSNQQPAGEAYAQVTALPLAA